MMQQIRDGALFEIRLLGSFRVVINGLPIAESRWTRQKPKLLLKLLALEPQHQLHREQLLEMLWPDQDTEAALRNLHRALHIARRALEPDLTAGATSQFLATRGQQVLLQAPGQLRIDLEEFEQRAAEALSVRDLATCESALALYTGDLLIEGLLLS